MCVYAFEPHEEIHKFLVEHVKLNNLEDRVRIYNLACYSEKGQTLKCCYDGNSGLSSLGKNFKRAKRYFEKLVDVDTVDNIVVKEKISKIDFMKLDTEGCELFVLRGAKNSIKQFKPIILAEAELRNTEAFEYKPGEIKELLIQYGYFKIEQYSQIDILAS
jgi:FkbM family methyltransferase